MIKNIIDAKNAPNSDGPFSAALLIDETLYVSGMVPIDSENNTLVYGTVENQVHCIMKNLLLVLNEAEMTFDNIFKATIFLKDLKDYNEFNTAYGEYFKGIVPPVRSLVQVAQLPGDVSVMIEITAKK